MVIITTPPGYLQQLSLPLRHGPPFEHMVKRVGIGLVGVFHFQRSVKSASSFSAGFSRILPVGSSKI